MRKEKGEELPCQMNASTPVPLAERNAGFSKRKQEEDSELPRKRHCMFQEGRMQSLDFPKCSFRGRFFRARRWELLDSSWSLFPSERRHHSTGANWRLRVSLQVQSAQVFEKSSLQSRRLLSLNRRASVSPRSEAPVQRLQADGGDKQQGASQSPSLSALRQPIFKTPSNKWTSPPTKASRAEASRPPQKDRAIRAEVEVWISEWRRLCSIPRPGRTVASRVKKALIELVSKKPPLEASQCLFPPELAASSSSASIPTQRVQQGESPSRNDQISLCAFERPSALWGAMGLADKAFVVGSLLRLRLYVAAASLLMDMVFNETLSPPLFLNVLGLVRSTAEAVTSVELGGDRADAFIGGQIEAALWTFLTWDRLWSVGLCMRPCPVEPWRVFLSAPPSRSLQAEALASIEASVHSAPLQLMPTILLCCRSRQAFLIPLLQREGRGSSEASLRLAVSEEAFGATSAARALLDLFENKPNFIRQWRALRQVVLSALPNLPCCYLSPLEDERRLLRLFAVLGLDRGWGHSVGKTHFHRDINVAASRAAKVETLQRVLSRFPVYVHSQTAAFQNPSASGSTLHAAGRATGTFQAPRESCALYFPSYLSTRVTLAALEKIYIAAASRLAAADPRAVNSLALEKPELHLALVVASLPSPLESASLASTTSSIQNHSEVWSVAASPRIPLFERLLPLVSGSFVGVGDDFLPSRAVLLLMAAVRMRSRRRLSWTVRNANMNIQYLRLFHPSVNGAPFFRATERGVQTAQRLAFATDPSCRSVPSNSLSDPAVASSSSENSEASESPIEKAALSTMGRTSADVFFGGGSSVWFFARVNFEAVASRHLLRCLRQVQQRLLEEPTQQLQPLDQSGSAAATALVPLTLLIEALDAPTEMRQQLHSLVAGRENRAVRTPALAQLLIDFSGEQGLLLTHDAQLARLSENEDAIHFLLKGGAGTLASLRRAAAVVRVAMEEAKAFYCQLLRAALVKIDTESSSSELTSSSPAGLLEWQLLPVEGRASGATSSASVLSGQPALELSSQCELALLTEVLGSPLAFVSRALLDRLARSLLRRVGLQLSLDDATARHREGNSEDRGQSLETAVSSSSSDEELPVLLPTLIRAWRLKHVVKAATSVPGLKSSKEGEETETPLPALPLPAPRSDVFQEAVAPLLLQITRTGRLSGLGSEEAEETNVSQLQGTAESPLLQLPLDALAELLTAVDEELRALSLARMNGQKNFNEKAASSSLKSESDSTEECVLNDLYSEGLALFEARLSRAGWQELTRLAARTPHLSKAPSFLFVSGPEESGVEEQQAQLETRQRRVFFFSAVFEECASRLAEVPALTDPSDRALLTEGARLVLLLIQMLSASSEAEWKILFSLLERKGCSAAVLGLCFERLISDLRQVEPRVFVSSLVAFARLGVVDDEPPVRVGEGAFFSPFEDAAIAQEEALSEATKGPVVTDESQPSATRGLPLLLPGAFPKLSFFSTVSVSTSRTKAAFRKAVLAAVYSQLGRGALDQLRIYETVSLFWSLVRLGVASLGTCLPLLDKCARNLAFSNLPLIQPGTLEVEALFANFGNCACLCRVEAALRVWGEANPACGLEAMPWLQSVDTRQSRSSFQNPNFCGTWGSPWLTRENASARGVISEAACLLDPATARRLLEAWTILLDGEARAMASRLAELRPLTISFLSFLESVQNKSSECSAISSSAECLLQEAELRRLVSAASSVDEEIRLPYNEDFAWMRGRGAVALPKRGLVLYLEKKASPVDEDAEDAQLLAEAAVTDLIVSHSLSPMLLREEASSPETRKCALFALSCGDTPLLPCIAGDVASLSAQKSFARKANRQGFRLVKVPRDDATEFLKALFRKEELKATGLNVTAQEERIRSTAKANI